MTTSVPRRSRPIAIASQKHVRANVGGAALPNIGTSVSTDNAALCDLGRIVTYDDSTTTTAEWVAAIAATFFHTVALVRALGACATREHMLLHYDFCAAVDQHDSLPLYVCSVDDDTLAYRVAKALKCVRHALSSKPGSECRFRLQVDCGVTSRAQRKRVEVQRNVRRAQRLEQLWREYRATDDDTADVAPSASALLPSPASPSSSSASHASSSASWWTWMRRTVNKKSAPNSFSPSSSPSSASLSAAVARAVAETDGNDVRDASILEQSTLAASETRSVSSQHSASSFSRSSWEAAVGMAESAAAARLLGDDAATTAGVPPNVSALGAAITLLPREHECVRQMVMNELELRATEDDELCDHVWEQWRLEIVVHPSGSPMTKQERARCTASECRQLMLKITERCVERAEFLPPLTTSTWVTCWPLRLSVCATTCDQNQGAHNTANNTTALVSTLWSMDDDFSHDDSARSGSGVHAWSSLHASACSPPSSTSAFNLGCEFLREFISAPSKTAAL